MDDHDPTELPATSAADHETRLPHVIYRCAICRLELVLDPNTDELDDRKDRPRLGI